MASGRTGAQKDEQEDLAKAFQELAKGERTATALENQLSKMEARIQALLDQAENEQREVAQLKSSPNSAGNIEYSEGSSEGKNS